MDEWGYGAFGNHGYDYIQKESVIRNYNSDYAGLVLWESYYKVAENHEIQPYYDETLRILNFDDVNKNFEPDEGEYDETDSAGSLYHGDQEITSEEYDAYQIKGNNLPIYGTETAPEIIAQLLAMER
jgi:hypothetical protein